MVAKLRRGKAGANNGSKAAGAANNAGKAAGAARNGSNAGAPPTADEPAAPPQPTSALTRVAAVLVGALVVGLSPGSKLRVEGLCADGATLAASSFCGLAPGRRVAACMAAFAALMLLDLAVAAGRAAGRAALATPPALAAFAAEAFEDAVAEWCERRAAAAKRARTRPSPPSSSSSASRSRRPRRYSTTLPKYEPECRSTHSRK